MPSLDCNTLATHAELRDAHEPDAPHEFGYDSRISGGDPLTIETLIVVTPDGVGTVEAVHASAALVRTESGLRPWPISALTRIDGSPVNQARDEVRMAAHRAQLVEAQTPAGTALRGGYRLVGLDLSAGSGWIIHDATGAAVAYVRARIGDDGRRCWWLQCATGGAPFASTYPEPTSPDQPHPAVRAAGSACWYLRPSAPEHGPVAASEVRRTVTLTVARVRELRALPISLSGDDTVRWKDRWRRYELSVDQMITLAAAAHTALATAPNHTAQHRLRRRVLIAAEQQLQFHAYDTARALATIPPPSTHDAYDQPYAHPAHEVTPVDLDKRPSPNPAPPHATATPNPTSTACTHEISSPPQVETTDRRHVLCLTDVLAAFDHAFAE